MDYQIGGWSDGHVNDVNSLEFIQGLEHVPTWNPGTNSTLAETWPKREFELAIKVIASRDVFHFHLVFQTKTQFATVE